jgi:hypothetical protein
MFTSRDKHSSVLLMVLLFVSLAAAVQESAAQSAGTTARLALDGQDVITASDAGGGYLYTGNIVFIVIFVLAVFGLAAVLLSGRGREEDDSAASGCGLISAPSQVRGRAVHTNY